MSEEPLEVLLLDVGNTIAFLDMEAVASIARAHGVAVEARELLAVEGEAKRGYEALMARGVSHADAWGLYFVALFEALFARDPGRARVDPRALIAPMRAVHDQLNLWRRVPPELPAALDRIRARGVRLGIVSNSEGQLDPLLRHVGLRDRFEHIVDSHYEGVRKPDPEIFRRALARMRVTAPRAVYLGDIPGVDVVGANAAGIAAVLIDPYGFYAEHAGERASSVAEWIDRHLAHR